MERKGTYGPGNSAKKRDAARWATVDAYARKGPSRKSASLKETIAYLSKVPLPKDKRGAHEALARAVFTWMSANIKYNYSGYLKGNYGSNDAESVYKSGCGVCEGYSNLFVNMCSALGVKARKISGWAKGVSYSPGMSFKGKSTNHAWCAVYLPEGSGQDAKEILVDATWGAGYIMNGEFKQVFTGFFFDCDPYKLVLSHFPKNKEDQMLPSKEQHTMDQFDKGPQVHSHFFADGLSFLSPESKHAVVTTDQKGRFKIVLDGAEDAVIMATLKGNRGGKCTGAFVQRRVNNDIFEVHGHLDNADSQADLDILSRPADVESNSYLGAVEYTVVKPSGAKSDVTSGDPFPKTYGAYSSGDDEDVLVSPLTGSLPGGTTVPFEFHTTCAGLVSVSAGGQRSRLSKQKEQVDGLDVWKGDVQIPDKAGQAIQLLIVRGELPKSGSYSLDVLLTMKIA